MKSQGWAFGTGILWGWSLLTSLSLVTFAAAGPPDAAPKDKAQAKTSEPPDATLAEINEETDAVYGHPLKQIRELREGVLAEIEATEEQKAKVHEILDAKVKLASTTIRDFEDFRSKNERRREEWRAQLEEAKAQGDRRRMDELEKQLARFGAGPGRVRKSLLGYEREVAGVFGPEKAPQVYAIANRVQRQYRPVFKPTGPTTVLMALKRIELSPEQQGKINEERTRMSENMLKVIDTPDPGPIDRVTADFRDRVLKVLTEEQRAEFNKYEEEIRDKPL